MNRDSFDNLESLDLESKVEHQGVPSPNGRGIKFLPSSRSHYRKSQKSSNSSPDFARPIQFRKNLELALGASDGGTERRNTSSQRRRNFSDNPATFSARNPSKFKVKMVPSEHSVHKCVKPQQSELVDNTFAIEEGLSLSEDSSNSKDAQNQPRIMNVPVPHPNPSEGLLSPMMTVLSFSPEARKETFADRTAYLHQSNKLALRPALNDAGSESSASNKEAKFQLIGRAGEGAESTASRTAGVFRYEGLDEQSAFDQGEIAEIIKEEGLSAIEAVLQLRDRSNTSVVRSIATCDFSRPADVLPKSNTELSMMEHPRENSQGSGSSKDKRSPSLKINEFKSKEEHPSLRDSFRELETDSNEHQREHSASVIEEEYGVLKRNAVKIWLTMAGLFSIYVTHDDVTNEVFSTPLWYKAITVAATVILNLCSLYAWVTKGNKLWICSIQFETIRLGLIVLHIKYVFSIFKEGEILDPGKDSQTLSFSTITTLYALQFNHAIMNHMFPDRRVILNSQFVVIVLAGCTHRFFGIHTIWENLNKLTVSFIVFMIYVVVYQIVDEKLIRLAQEEAAAVLGVVRDIENKQKASQEYQEMFETLSSAVVVVKNDTVNYLNKHFKSILRRIIRTETEDILDLPMFRIFRKGEDESRNEQTQSNLSRRNSQDEIEVVVMSIRQVLEKDQEFLDNTIFEVQQEEVASPLPSAFRNRQSINNTFVAGLEQSPPFKFVQLKLSHGVQSHQQQERKALLQIIDVSDKMLYGEVKAEQTFLSLINAAVSHELRNPLNSLIGQISSMKDYFTHYDQVIAQMRATSHKAESGTQAKMTEFLEQIRSGLGVCSSKIYSAVSFIDFFVHDILDYTILNKEEKSFLKDMKIFDVREAVTETIDLQQDKIEMKSIKARTLFRGFDHDSYFVKTDRKRLQQVLLNLVSNAIKFTGRNGKILVAVDLLSHGDDGNKIRVSIIDSGMGVKRKDRKKLFKLFGSVKNQKAKINTNGIGIGLVISKLIVGKFGGDIDFRSKPNKGSIFFFDFEIMPFTKDDLEEQKLKERDEQAVEEKLATKIPSLEAFIEKNSQVVDLKTQSNSHIRSIPTELSVQDLLVRLERLRVHKSQRYLVVDDEEFCLSSMKALLKKAGVDLESQVDLCITGEESLQMVKQAYKSGLNYSIIFTDFSMPVMNGIESTRKIRHFFKHELSLAPDKQPKIIGVTGHVLSEFREQGISAGMNSVISKPVYYQTLKEMIDKQGIFNDSMGS